MVNYREVMVGLTLIESSESNRLPINEGQSRPESGLTTIQAKSGHDLGTLAEFGASSPLGVPFGRCARRPVSSRSNSHADAPPRAHAPESPALPRRGGVAWIRGGQVSLSGDLLAR